MLMVMDHDLGNCISVPGIYLLYKVDVVLIYVGLV